MRLIDADALEELFREVIGNIAKRPEIGKDLEHMVRASAMAVQMIQDAPTIGGWISVKDRLPEEDGEYLVFMIHKTMVLGYANRLTDVDQFDFNENTSGWYDYDSEYGFYQRMDVTYWMPLPEPPKEVTGDD